VGADLTNSNVVISPFNLQATNDGDSVFTGSRTMATLSSLATTPQTLLNGIVSDAGTSDGLPTKLLQMTFSVVSSKVGVDATHFNWQLTSTSTNASGTDGAFGVSSLTSNSITFTATGGEMLV